MGEPVFLQYPLVGGLDEQTAATYLDPQQNQSSIVNGNFAHVGAVNVRQGIQADTELATALVLNPNGIAVPYVPPSLYATALGAIGNLILQGPWAWSDVNKTASFAGKLGNASVVRRPLPVHTVQLPIICDAVPSPLQGTVRAAAWISMPDDPAGTSTFQVESAFLDPNTSQRVLTFPTLGITAKHITLVNLIWFPNTGILSLFVIVETAASAARELRVYSVTPGNNDNAWTIQAGATLALFNNDATSLDVQPMTGDPNDGYIVLYLPTGAATTLNWRYFKAYASVSSGALAVGTQPGIFPCHVVADWGIDVAFVWSDNPGADDTLHVDYFSADGLFTAITTYTGTPSTQAAFGPFAYPRWQLGGACRVYDKTNATLSSEIYLAFWAQDTTYFSVGGPSMPVAMGGLVARSVGPTVTPLGFSLYPAGLVPLARPTQIADGGQVVGQYIHVFHACAQDYMMFNTSSVPIANVTASNPTCEQVTEYVVDFRCRAQAGVPLAIFSAQATIVASIAPRQLDPYLERWSNSMFLPFAQSRDRASMVTSVAIAGTGVSGQGADVSTMWLSVTSAAKQPQAANVNDTIELSGGVPMRVGPIISEHGFIHFPEFITAAATAGTLTGTYSYAVVYVRQDAQGNIERSAPSILANPIVLAAQKTALTFPRLAWNNFGGNIYYEIYRTLTLGSTYFCVARVGDDLIGGPGPYATYQDQLSDANLGKAEILYTTGGILDNVNPPAASAAIAHRGRLAIVDETRTNVWFTKSETGGEVLGFNEELISPFIEGGDITAIASMDDKFVVFKSDSIWIQYGDGPADNGQNSDWTIPQAVPTDVGAASSAGVVTIPGGVLFVSSVGIHMLGRDLQVAYIGKAIKDTFKVYSTCISSCIVPYAKQVRWCMQDVNGNQIIVVYDYFINAWSTHSYLHLDGAIVQLLLTNGVFTVITAPGGRYVESASSNLDTSFAPASFFVPLKVVLPWVKVSGPQGYMRSRRTLVYSELEDPCGIQVDAAFNYDPAIKQTKQWAYEALEARPTEQVEMHTHRYFNKCESMQVTLTTLDSTSKTTGQGMTLEAVGFDMDKIGDRFRRLPARLKG